MTEYKEILSVCGGAVIAVCCLLVLRTYGEKSGIGNITALGFSVLLAAAAVYAAIPLYKELQAMTVGYLPDELQRLLWRAAAVGITVQLTSDFIRDAGEGALADKVDMLGRVSLLAIGFPVFTKLLSMAAAFFGGGG